VPGEDGNSFLERALDDSRLHAVAISDELEAAVFGAVPRVAEGLLGDEPRTPENLDAAFENALVFLYRVLFCLFAEARGLLPVPSPEYRRYSVASQRVEIARMTDEGRYLSPASTGYWDDLQALFRMIEGGEPGLGVTEYDGPLFDPREHPYLEARAVSDPLLAPALDRLYRTGGAFVDHRDLSVRSLGTVYERLLAWQLVEADDGALTLAESPLRHETGSYFTPEAVVDAIVERTLDPILTRVAREASESDEDVLERMLAIDVLDPAMGSGHFLVGAVEYIAQAIATEPAYDGDHSLADLRRLVAERCLYGVDLNPLAVELARLSLWLVTARVGEPLSFLGNLRVGNSLVGADNETLLDRETGGCSRLTWRRPPATSCGRSRSSRHERRAPLRTREPSAGSQTGSTVCGHRSKSLQGRRSSDFALPTGGRGSTGRSSSPTCSSTGTGDRTPMPASTQ